MHHHRLQHNNLTKREKAALERLRANPDIIIKPADKGGATVILNKEDYITEAMRQLTNEEYYSKLDTDLTLYYQRIINQGINNGDLQIETGQLLRGCPCKNRPLDFGPKTEFLQIFRVRQLVHMINKTGNNWLSMLFFNISGDNIRGRYKIV